MNSQETHTMSETNNQNKPWIHTIIIDNKGETTVLSNSGNELPSQYYRRWWYGDLTTDPRTHPSADTRMIDNNNPAAIFLRS